MTEDAKPVAALDLRARSVRTLAWLGDADFEREVRRRVVARGDYPVDRLDAVKALVVRAESQAALLAAIEGELEEDERSLVRRARNQSPRSGGRVQRDTRAYRSATALEALVGLWFHGGEPGPTRFEALLGARIEAAIDAALAVAGARIRRG
ncbi:MAG: ribonuclease III domain-containing protein [Nannocystaceae bacterium]